MKISEVTAIELPNQGLDSGVVDISTIGELIGKIDNLKLYSIRYGAEVKVTAVTGEPNKRNQAQRVMDLWLEKIGSSWVVNIVRSNKKYRGYDVAPKVYRYLIKKGIVLQAGTLQSVGGRAVWNKLAQYPDIEMFGVSKQDPHIEIRAGDQGAIEAVDPDIDIYSGNRIKVYARAK